MIDQPDMDSSAIQRSMALRTLIPVAVGSLTTACASTPEKTPECEILDYGITVGVSEDRVLSSLNDGTNTKLGRLPGVIDIADTTTTIPAVLGLEFGIFHRFTGVPPQSKILLETTHPSISYGSESSTGSSRFKRSTDSGTAFAFDLPEELVAVGPWLFVFSYEGHELCRQNFQVVVADD